MKHPKHIVLILALSATQTFAGTDSQDAMRREPGSFDTVSAVIPIDQKHALAGGISPNDTPGFPVTITQPGSYRLNGNLTVPDLNTTAIEITADFVTLDLNGFSIIGPAVCSTRPDTACPPSGSGTGVRVVERSDGNAVSSPRGIRIVNGSVRGMGLFGVMLSGDGSSVERLTADSNVGGGIYVAGSVIQSIASRNGSFGIVANTVRDSTSSQNVGDGIILGALGTNGGVATGSVSASNGGSGIVLQVGTATGNTLFLNKSSGVSALCPSSIVGNAIVTNGPLAIETKGDGCALASNATRP